VYCLKDSRNCYLNYHKAIATDKIVGAKKLEKLFFSHFIVDWIEER
jgi:hypothetical protein